MSNFIVGLTGGIGSGKTAVSNRFAKLGVGIVDADVIAREVVEPGTDALAKIAAHFGQHLIQSDGQLDRAALRQTIFSDADAKQWLESLLHPLIANETARQLAAVQSSYAIYVSPLLVEGNQQGFCQRLVVVDVPESVQLERTMKRDSNEQAQVERIIAASDVIDNNAGFAELDKQISQLHQQFLDLARNSKAP